MQRVAPAGPVYQAGTLSGNPLAMSAGIATLKELQKPGVWEAIERHAVKLAAGLGAAAEAARTITQRAGTMFTTFFTDRPVINWATAQTADTKKFSAFFRAMLEAGVYTANGHKLRFFFQRIGKRKNGF